MPTSLSPVDICNVALSKIGAQAINSLTDLTNASSIQCNLNFNLAYQEVSRATVWNCLLTTAVLVQITQTPLPSSPPPSPVTAWAPNTSYLANVYVTYGGYYYQVMFNYTSTNNFTNDLTTGALTQTNLPTSSPLFPNTGGSFPSGWAYGYALPSDFLLLASVNDNVCNNIGYGDDSSEYEIIGSNIYCDDSQVVIKYIQNVPDTTRFDPLLTNVVACKLAAMISTPLRQDSGKLEAQLEQLYRIALKEARAKNGGEKKERRFNPIDSSMSNRARWGGING